MILKNTKTDEAVSPVVGVMLMLVVTIIIAAAVSGFAGSITEDQKTAPQVTMAGTVKINGDLNETIFENLGGDAFDLRDIQVVFKSDNTKTTLDVASAGTDCIEFVKVGTGNLIKPGEMFKIIGDGSGYSAIEYGSFSLYEDTIVYWKIIDVNTGNAMASGEMVIQ